MWQNFYSRCIPNRNVHTYVLKSVQNMFITVLFRVTPSCKQLRSPSTLEQVHKLWHIHSFSGILHRNKNELSTHSNVHKSHNVELKKPDPKEYFRCNSIYMKLNHKQTNVWGQKSWYLLLLAGKRDFWLGEPRGWFLHAGNVFLNLGGE